MRTCTEPDCDREAVVKLHVPWDEDRVVCAGHGRTIATQDGVVAEPVEDAGEKWP